MRVAITGIGVVSPFGVGRERFWEHIARGCSGTRAITEFDASDLMPDALQVAFLKGILDFVGDQKKLDSVLATLDAAQASAYK